MTAKKKNPAKRGPKPWIPTAEEIQRIEALASSGMTNQEICLALGIGRGSFYPRKSEIPEIDAAIKSGKAKANGMVHSALMKKVQAGDLGAIVWYEKTRRGMSDRVAVDANVGLTIVWDHELDDI
ncbi:MAG: hypothetical protein WC551_11425 [Patescibacteria group bacterium]